MLFIILIRKMTRIPEREKRPISENSTTIRNTHTTKVSSRKNDIGRIKMITIIG